MIQPTINFIGAGHLGQTIARLFVINNLATVAGICNSTYSSSLRAAEFIGFGQACENISSMPRADITFITLPDDKIESGCELYLRAKNFNPKGMVIHCSGLLTTDVLIAAKQKGCSTLSVHPMHSFADPPSSVERFAGTYCAIEGDESKVVETLFKLIGAKLLYIEKSKKALYHAAGVMASNYLVTLADTAIKNLVLAGICEHEAKNVVSHLMDGTLQNLIVSDSACQALTGPLKRGDVGTVRQHLVAIENDHSQRLYRSLGDLTLHLTNLDAAKKKELKELLNR